MNSALNFKAAKKGKKILFLLLIISLFNVLQAADNNHFLSPLSLMQNKKWEIIPADVKILPSNAEPWIFNSEDDSMRADLRVCIAVCAKNMVSGKTFMYHITSTAHFSWLKKLPERNKNDFQMAKEFFFTEFFKEISGNGWSVAIISSNPLRQYDFISARELKKYFLSLGVNENNIELDAERTEKTVFMNGKGKIFISPLLSSSGTQLIIPDEIMELDHFSSGAFTLGVNSRFLSSS